MRVTLRRIALVEGYSVYDGPKPPEAPEGFTTIPPLTADDARLVARALRTLAVQCASGEWPVSERARRLADVYDHAAEGHAALAAGVYSTLPPPRH